MDTRKVRINYFPRRMATLVSHRKNPNAYVYFISDGNAIKIGKGTNVFERLDQLQCGNPNKLQVVFAIPVKSEHDAYDMENALHCVYQDFKMCGEWFDIVGVLNRESFEREFGISNTITFEKEATETFEEKTKDNKSTQNSAPNTKPAFMTIRKIAETGIMPEYRLRKLVASGEIPSFKAGTRSYVNYENVVKFLSNY